MRISVVILVYNLEAYVQEAVDSVLSQTRPADEIIVVDDCSTDRSPDRIKSYGSAVTYLRMSKNSGALLAGLAGVKSADGDVICMLDGDDFWAPNKLEVVEREFTSDPELLLLSHDHVRVTENGNELALRDETHKNIAAIMGQATSAPHFSALLKETILDQRGYWLGSAYSFRRRLFDISKFESQIGCFSPEQLHRTYLDLVVAPFLVLTNPSKNVGYTPKTKFFYRVHGSASMGIETLEKALASVAKARAIVTLIRQLLSENDSSPSHLRRCDLYLQEYDYLTALYVGNRIKAAELFVRLARDHWNLNKIVKETQRFFGAAILGPRAFLKLRRQIQG